MVMMMGSARDDDFGKLQAPLSASGAVVSQSAYIIVSEVDQHHARAQSAGASIVMAPEDQEYGGRLYSCRDLEGNLWSFGTYDPRGHRLAGPVEIWEETRCRPHLPVKLQICKRLGCHFSTGHQSTCGLSIGSALSVLTDHSSPAKARPFLTRT